MSKESRMRQRLARVRAMPLGVARTQAAEWLVRTIDAEGPQELLPEALLDLVEAYCFGTPDPVVFAHFSRLSRLHDEHPEHFDDTDRRNFHWEHKWMANDLRRYPQIGLDQLQDFYTEMRRRFRLAGYDEQAVDYAESHLWDELGEEDRAAQARARWLSTPAGPMDCEDCRIGDRMRLLNRMGDHQAVLEVAIPSNAQCNREPGESLRQHARALLHLGRVEDSRRALAKAWAVERTEWTDIVWVCGDAEMLWRSGAVERGLQCLHDHSELLFATPTEPWTLLLALERLLVGLSGCVDLLDEAGVRVGQRATGIHPGTLARRVGLGIPEVPLPPSACDGVGVTMDGLREWALATALGIAELFDARNGSDVVTRRIRTANGAQALANVPWCDPGAAESGADGDAGDAVESGHRAPASGKAAGGLPTAVGGSADGGRARAGLAEEAAPETSGTVHARAEEEWQRENHVEAARLYERAADLALVEGKSFESALMRADAAHCHSLCGNLAHAHRCFLTAWPLITREGDGRLALRVLEAWGGVAERVFDVGALVEPVEFVRGMLADERAGTSSGEAVEDEELPGVCIDELRARVAVASLFERYGRAAEAEEVVAAAAPAWDAAVAYHERGMTVEAARCLALLGEAHQRVGRLSEAAEHLEDALAGYRQAGGHRREAGKLLDRLSEVLMELGERERLEEILAERL